MRGRRYILCVMAGQPLEGRRASHAYVRGIDAIGLR